MAFQGEDISLPTIFSKHIAKDNWTIIKFFMDIDGNFVIKSRQDIVDKFAQAGLDGLKKLGKIEETGYKTKDYKLGSRLIERAKKIYVKLDDIRINLFENIAKRVDGKILNSSDLARIQEYFYSKSKLSGLLPKQFNVTSEGLIQIEYYPARCDMTTSNTVKVVIDGNRPLSYEQWIKLSVNEEGQNNFLKRDYYRQMAQRKLPLSSIEIEAIIQEVQGRYPTNKQVGSISTQDTSIHLNAAIAKGKDICIQDTHQFIPENKTVRFRVGTDFQSATKLATHYLGTEPTLSIAFIPEGRPVTLEKSNLVSALPEFTESNGVRVNHRFGYADVLGGKKLTPAQQKIAEQLIDERLKSENLLKKKVTFQKNGQIKVDVLPVEYHSTLKQLNFPTTRSLSQAEAGFYIEQLNNQGHYHAARAQQKWLSYRKGPVTQSLLQETIAAITVRDGHPGTIHKVFEEIKPMQEINVGVGQPSQGHVGVSFDVREKVATLHERSPFHEQLEIVGKHCKSVGTIVFKHSLTVAAVYFSYANIAAAAEEEKPRVATEEILIWTGCALGATAFFLAVPTFATIAATGTVLGALGSAQGLGLLGGAFGVTLTHTMIQIKNYVNSPAFQKSTFAQNMRALEPLNLKYTEAELKAGRERFLAYLNQHNMHESNHILHAATAFYSNQPHDVQERIQTRLKSEIYYLRSLDILLKASFTNDATQLQHMLQSAEDLRQEESQRLLQHVTETDTYIIQRFSEEKTRLNELRERNGHTIRSAIRATLGDLIETTDVRTINNQTTNHNLPGKVELDTARQQFLSELNRSNVKEEDIPHAAHDFIPPHRGQQHTSSRGEVPANPIPIVAKPPVSEEDKRYYQQTEQLLRQIETTSDLTQLKILINRLDALMRERGAEVGEHYRLNEQDVALSRRLHEQHKRRDAMQADKDMPARVSKKRSKEEFITKLQASVQQPSQPISNLPVVAPRPRPQPVQNFVSHLWANKAMDHRFRTPIDEWRARSEFRLEASKSSVSYLKRENLYNALSQQTSSILPTVGMFGPRRSLIAEFGLRSQAKDAFERERMRGGSFGDAYYRMASQLGWPAGFDFRQFVNLLRSEGLVSSYNAIHVKSYSNIPWTGSLLREIGGVATRVGEIEGLDELLERGELQHFNFAIQCTDGSMPFTQDDLLQVLTELRAGIYVHDAFPFFSLHFNQDSALTPVIHPFYENTLVGYTISQLDYWMKGYTNGGTFDDEFLEDWHETRNDDKNYLKSNLIDLQKYCHIYGLKYRSLRELNFQVGLEFPPDSACDDATNPNSIYRMKFMTSFRIIAKQNQFQYDPTTHTFKIDADFDVEYSVDLMPDYQAFLESYRATHGDYPEDYKAVLELYALMAKRIHDEMPKLPMFKPYFQQLSVISFCSYLFNTLKKNDIVPDLPPLVNRRQVQVPKVYPHIPVRYYHFCPVELTFSHLFRLLDETKRQRFNQFFFEQVSMFNQSRAEACFEKSLSNDMKTLALTRMQEVLPAEALEENSEHIEEISIRFSHWFKTFFVEQARVLRDSLVTELKEANRAMELNISESVIASKALSEILNLFETGIQQRFQEDIKESHIKKVIEAQEKEFNCMVTPSIQGQIDQLQTHLNTTLQSLENQKQGQINQIPAHQRPYFKIDEFCAHVEAEKSRISQLFQIDIQKLRDQLVNSLNEIRQLSRTEWLRKVTERRDKRLLALQEQRKSLKSLLALLENNEELNQVGPTFKVVYSALELGNSPALQKAASHTQIVGGCGIRFNNQQLQKVALSELQHQTKVTGLKLQQGMALFSINLSEKPGACHFKCVNSHNQVF